ncbi:MAG: molecular chaperone TorD family protein [Planctomycetota bacterium]|jgi:nitrate reductase molybdenum cofactor assembly chaperone
MSTKRTLLPLFSPLIRYPHEGQEQAARAAIEKFGEYPEVQKHLKGYLEFLGRYDQYDLEEKYTQSFEINPAVALEVGYHLFGLAYQRGEFLARAKMEEEAVGIDSGSELADHLPVMLELAEKLTDEDSAMSLIQEAIFPAVQHMCTGFIPNDLKFGQAVVALHEYLKSNYECIVFTPAEQAQEEVASHV